MYIFIKIHVIIIISAAVNRIILLMGRNGGGRSKGSTDRFTVGFAKLENKEYRSARQPYDSERTS